MNKEMLNTYATICELYIGQSMQIKDIALYLAIDVNHVNRALNAYLSKPEHPAIITVDSIINNRTAYVLHNWGRLRAVEIADDLSIHVSTVWEICARAGINTKKRIMRDGWVMPLLKTCIILNRETGIYYYNAPEAAHAHGLKVRTLNDYLNRKTNTRRLRKFVKMELN